MKVSKQTFIFRQECKVMAWVTSDIWVEADTQAEANEIIQAIASRNPFDLGGDCIKYVTNEKIDYNTIENVLVTENGGDSTVIILDQQGTEIYSNKN